MMYKNFDRNTGSIGLHDCRATKVSLKKDVLAFEFEDGFWVGENNPKNPYGKVLGTDASRVDFHLLYGNVEDDLTFYAFAEKNGRTVRKRYSYKKLAKKLNDKGQELEFLYAYTGYNSIIFECELHFKKKPYRRECVMIISTDDVRYRWNNICEDKTV